MQEQVQASQHEAKTAHGLVQGHQSEYMALQQELHDQEVREISCRVYCICSDVVCAQEKRARALRQASRLVKAHREAAHVSDDATLEERDFRLRHLRDFTKNVCCVRVDVGVVTQCSSQITQQVDAAIHDFPDLVPEVQMLYDRAGITPLTTIAPKTGTSVYSVCFCSLVSF